MTGAGGIVSPNASLTRDEPGTRKERMFASSGCLFVSVSQKVVDET